MANPIRDRKNYPYHIKINGIGYILAEARGRSVYVKEEVPFSVTRSATGEAAYRDTKFWRRWVQEDWTKGIHQILWQDVSRFFESLNVDTTEEFKLTLAPKEVVQAALGHAIHSLYGSYRLVAVVGTNSGVWSFDGGSWREEGQIGAGDYGYCVRPAPPYSDRYVFIGTGDMGDNNAEAKIYIVDTGSAANLTEKANLDTQLEGTVHYVLDIIDYGGKLWALTGSHTHLAQSTDDGVTWTSFKNLLKAGYRDMNYGALAKYAGYLIVGGGKEGEGFLLATDGVNEPVEIGDFKWTGIIDLEEWGGFLWIATTGSEIWYFDGATITQFFSFPPDWGITIRDLFAAEGELWISTVATDASKEGIYIINKNGIRHSLRVGAGTDLWDMAFFGDAVHLGTTDPSTPVYKVDMAKYQDSGDLISSFHDAGLPTIPKLYHEVTLQTDPLPANTSVQLWWRAEDSDEWASLGTLSTTGEVKKTFAFPAGTIETRIKMKITLAQTATSDDVTPTVKKVIVKYDLSPYLVNVWTLRVVCADKIRLLNNSIEAKNGQELMENLWAARRAAKVVTLQDIDYTETQLNGELAVDATTVTVDSTKGFPKKGRIRIEDEEIEYTGKTATTFTGCLRGKRGTVAAIHADDTQVDTGYNILVYQPHQSINTMETLEGELEMTLLEA